MIGLNVASLAAALVLVTVATGAEIPFPKAPSSFHDRASAIINYNACGNETNFDTYFQNLQNSNYDPQGEPLTSIVIAKIQAYYSGIGCIYARDTQVPPAALTAASGCVQQAVNPVAANQVHTVTSASPACLKQQINSALMLYQKHDQPGTKNSACVPGLAALPFTQGGSLLSSSGDYDVDVREIVRALYLGAKAPGYGPVLNQATIDHLVNDVSTLRGEPGPDTYSPIYDCGDREDSTGSPEDWANQQSFLDRAVSALGTAGDNILKRILMFLAIFYLGQAQYLTGMVASPPVGVVPINPLLVTGGIEVVDAFPGSRVPETENHRLMIETSRYLINQWIIDALETAGGNPNLDTVKSEQSDVKQWLMQRLRQFTKQDFDEYNSRIYTRYSMNAILNLFDFAEDPQVRIAAQIVLDYLSAKGAVSSNLARRYAPFRRKTNNDGYAPLDPNDPLHNAVVRNLYNSQKGADFQVMWQLVEAGQTQLADQSPLGDQGPLEEAGMGDGVNPSVSSYRMPDFVLELATGRLTYMQRFHHAGVEIYSSAPSYLLSAGGVPTPPANKIFGLGDSSDAGVALPTVLIPTDGGVSVDDLIRFEGVGTGGDREQNLCVFGGFACGKNLVVPPQVFGDRGCSTPVDALPVHWVFIKSTGCVTSGLATGSHPFYVAAARIDCPNAPCLANNFGMIEVVDAPNAKVGSDPAFDQFVSSRPAALKLAAGAWGSVRPTGTYTASDGTVIEFDALGRTDLPPMSTTRPLPVGIMTVNGSTTPDPTSLTLAYGQLISSLGDGLIVITSPKSGSKLFLDFRDPNAPARSIVP
jgi:hypothetical protein